MTAAVVDPLAYVLHRVSRVLTADAAEDCALAVVTRYLTGGGPRWLVGRADTVQLDVLAVSDLLARRRG